MNNPTIKELQNEDKYELIAELNHQQIKEFVLQQLSGGGKIIWVYMIYQVLMILLGLFFFTSSIVQVFQNNPEAFYFSIGALVFCFSILIVLHELLHGVALKITGAKRINFGGYPKKFIFYAEADQFVINRKQFAFIALTPLVLVKLVSFAGIIIFLSQPILYFFIIVMSAHSLFCAGDIGMLSIFYKYKDESEIYTYDVKAEKKSYYFHRKNGVSEPNNSSFLT
jgi:hypothetical protein